MEESYFDIEIRKPLHKFFVYIRDIKVKTALRENRMLRITIPDGTWIVSPKIFMDKAKTMKKEFLIPGQPMTLIGNYVTRGRRLL